MVDLDEKGQEVGGRKLDGARLPHVFAYFFAIVLVLRTLLRH